jgi:DNA-binding GntR family transcriptional regulator
LYVTADTADKPQRVTAAGVADTLRRQLLYGEFAGDSVLEEEVAAELGVSRTPVREAIRMLVGEGLLLKEHSRSARVFRPSLADLKDIYDIRGPLEAMAARRAAGHGGPALADELAAMLDHLAEAEPGLSYSSRHEAFHLRLTEANGSDRLTSLIRTLRAQSEPYVRLALQAADDFRQTASEQHWAIVEAVRARDGEQADALVEAHLRNSVSRVPRILSLSADERQDRLAHGSVLTAQPISEVLGENNDRFMDPHRPRPGGRRPGQRAARRRSSPDSR